MSVRFDGSSPIQPQNEKQIRNFGKSAISKLKSFCKRTKSLVEADIKKIETKKNAKIKGSKEVSVNPSFRKEQAKYSEFSLL